MGGDLTMSIDPGARSLTLSKDGAAPFRYAGLSAWDADGRELKTWLETAGTQLSLRVIDAGARYPLTIDPVVQASKLVAQDGVAGDQLGRSVAISSDGRIVVVGAPFKRNNNIRSGVAYVFVKPPDAQGGWDSSVPLGFANKLIASDYATTGLRLGASVDVSRDGSTIVVGATGVNQSTVAGAAYVFERALGGWGGGSTVVQNAKLTPAQLGYSAFGSFGYSVTIDEYSHSIVVGAPLHTTTGQTYDGAAFAFFKPLATGYVNATESYRIRGVSATGLVATMFGSSVSLSADRHYLIVGSPAEWGYRGAAYMFKLAFNNGLYFQRLARFYKLDGGPYESFGTAVAINGNGSSFAVSAPGAPINGSAQGAVLVFQSTAADTWVQTARLTMADGNNNDSLGDSVSMSHDGNTIVAGSSDYSGTTPGAAYVFVKPATGWVNATENAKLTTSDGFPGDRFGHAISVSADGATWVGSAPFAAIGAAARQGTAYVFTGVADNPIASVSPTSLTFGPVGENAANPQIVMLTNVGAGPLHVYGVAVDGPFTATQNCLSASPLAPGSSCSEEVTYVPISIGHFTGTLTFTDNSAGVAGAIQQVSLQGFGIKVSTSTAITAVSTNSALVGQPVMVSFAVAPQSGATMSPSGTVTVQASTGESCTGSAPSGSCAITFATAADRTLTATYSGDDTFNPSTSPAGSIGIVDFSVSVSPGSLTATGKKASYTLTVAGMNGFAGTVSLACGGPANTTCEVSPGSVTLPGTTTAKATVALRGATSGTYLMTFTGTFGGVTRTTTASLTVR